MTSKNEYCTFSAACVEQETLLTSGASEEKTLTQLISTSSYLIRQIDQTLTRQTKVNDYYYKVWQTYSRNTYCYLVLVYIPN